MYETEVNGRAESVDQIPAAIRQRFDDLAAQVTTRTVLPWGEHCTECVWPTCYTTCDLYSPRTDGKCRRFVDGMVRLDAPQTANGYLLKISFKQWGKLWAPGNVHLVPRNEARTLEQRDRRVGQTLYQITMPAPVKRFAMWRRYDYKKKRAQSRPGSAESPQVFVAECYNPTGSAIGLSLTMRPDDPSHPLPFQTLLTAAPGYSRFVVPMADIERAIDVHAPFSIELIPNNVPDGTTLYFGMLDFAAGTGLAPAAATSAPGRNGTSADANGNANGNANGKAKGDATGEATTDGKKTKVKTYKCVVWDLDNTMWDGILVEDGAAALRLKPGIASIIQQLDQRGILHSVASKNDAPEALKVLEQFGLREYFLYPEISWGPKSEAIKRIAQQLNIGIDSMLFVDDSDFELAQVTAGCPEIRTLNATAYESLLTIPETQVPVTAEASERRKMYQTESVRQTVAGRFGDDYLAFLRDCHLEAHLRPLTPDNVQRVHELTQRTNQMNFSGNRYDRAVLERIIATPYLDTYVLDCRDRFGDYGVVGFCIVDSREPRVTDLAFSCRVQSKRVEHALLSFILRRYRDPAVRDVYANYRKTPRNAPSGRVFEDVGFELAGETDAGSSLIFPRTRDVPDDGIIEVIYHPAEISPAGVHPG
jgi:FkbH-like protein